LGGRQVVGVTPFAGRRGNLLIVVTGGDEARAKADVARLH
jgi:hypothetical protein